MDNQEETIYDEAEMLPFLSFFEELKRKKFSVTPLQIINAHRVIIEYSCSLKNEQQLYLYLSPLFAGTEEEQILFKQVFDHHFKGDSFTYMPPPNKKIYKNYVRKNYKGLIAGYVLLAIAIVAILIYTGRPREINPLYVTVSFKDITQHHEDENEHFEFQLKSNEKLEIETACRYKGFIKPGLDVHINNDWGDGKKDDLAYHIYNSPGKYHLLITAWVIYKNDTITGERFDKFVSVCDQETHLALTVTNAKDHAIDTIKANEQLYMSAVITGVQPGHDSDIVWYSNDSSFDHGKRISTAFDAGYYKISCKVICDSINSNCILQKDSSFTVSAAQYTGPIKQIVAVKEELPDTTFVERPPAYLFQLYGILAIAFFLLTIVFMLLWNKETRKKANIKRSAQEKLNAITTASKDRQEIKTLSFKNKNSLPVDENEFNTIIRQMRNRVRDTVSFLHIGKTIKSSLNTGGLFQPVIESRTRQSEYLILIDENNNNIQQVKFFEYLSGILKKQNVLIEKYYYKDEPARFYNLSATEAFDLERLSEAHPGHILLFFGNAHKFIKETEHEINSEWLELINRWQYKAIITPVSFLDWSEIEKEMLLPEIPIFPADMEGLSLMADLMNVRETETESNIILRLKQNSGVFYKIKGINFKKITDLNKYCEQAGWARITENGKHVNILFEWIAALAIYPAIHWEMIIAIGKAVLDRYNMGEELNFTNLLRIVRIDWIRQGYFPAELRLELLKKLKDKNEVVARQTILQLLHEISKEHVGTNSAANEEMEMQRIINEFSLYAYNPVIYSSYIESKPLFEKLWKDEKIDDASLKAYLQNDTKKWSTLINVEKNDLSVNNAGIEEYFISSEKEETVLSRLYLWLGIISVFVFVCSVMAFRILYIWDTVL